MVMALLTLPALWLIQEKARINLLVYGTKNSDLTQKSSQYIYVEKKR